MTIDTVAGVPNVVNRGEAPEWALEETLILGGGEAVPDAELFGRIASIVVDVDGNIYAADGLRRAIYVFSAAGAHLRTIGREGAGPGEFRLPRSLGLLGDTLAVHDDLNARMGLFALDGTWLDHWRIATANGSITQTSPHEFWATTARRISPASSSCGRATARRARPTPCLRGRIPIAT